MDAQFGVGNPDKNTLGQHFDAQVLNDLHWAANFETSYFRASKCRLTVNQRGKCMRTPKKILVVLVPKHG